MEHSRKLGFVLATVAVATTAIVPFKMVSQVASKLVRKAYGVARLLKNYAKRNARGVIRRVKNYFKKKSQKSHHYLSQFHNNLE
ncbi:hypothetical protein V6N13_070188 [Hibiscus sabdariffa]|uniref:Uncharacterized protein n=1 Tax=Hibiscus sabdariffa TaxID=183260 RepID=A0ABR2NB61_9ROSI